MSSESCLILSEAKAGTAYTVHLRGSISEFENYDCLYKLIKNVEPDDTVTVYINSTGGRCDVGFSLVHLFLSCVCPVAMVVEYPTYSMGAILALCGDTVVFNPDSYLMFHDYSGVEVGKGGETWMHSDQYRKIFKEKFTKICGPFLTRKEINTMFKGEDIYIRHDDPTLEDRVKRHFK